MTPVQTQTGMSALPESLLEPQLSSPSPEPSRQTLQSTTQTVAVLTVEQVWGWEWSRTALGRWEHSASFHAFPQALSEASSLRKGSPKYERLRI